METKSTISVKNLTFTALFIALSLVGSYIKIFGTVAFDSLPGFLAALILGPAYGAAIGLLGHLFTALSSGFPLSLPLHLVIAVSMAITMYVYGIIYRVLKKKFPETPSLVITGIVGILFNAPVSLGFSMAALGYIAGWNVATGLLALLPALIIASTANVLLSLILYKSLSKVWSKMITSKQEV